MSAFEYTALDPKGKQLKGLIEGDTPRQARQMLRERGLAPLDLVEVAESARSAQPSMFQRGGSLYSTELSLFTRQLATLSRSGLPLDEALTAVSEQSESKRVKRIALGVRSSVVEGNTLASSLSQFPKVVLTICHVPLRGADFMRPLSSSGGKLSPFAIDRNRRRSPCSVALRRVRTD